MMFEYAIKANVAMLNPEWKLRNKDYVALEYLEKALAIKGIRQEDVFKQVWSYNPYWIKKGYKEFMRSTVARPLR
jgi:hypothetical protein